MVGGQWVRKPAHNTLAKIGWRSSFAVPVPASETESYASETLIYMFTQAYILTDVLTLEYPHMPAHTRTHMLPCINLFYILFPLPGQNGNWNVYGNIIRLWDCQKSTNHVSPLGLGSCTIITTQKSSGRAYFLKMCRRFGHILYSFSRGRKNICKIGAV